MASELRNLAAVKAKSEELQIPYANLLSAFVVEEIVVAVSESEESEHFWLKNDAVLTLESYKRKAPNRLEYMFSGEEGLTVEDMTHRMRLIFQNEKRTELKWKYQVEKTGAVVRVHLLGRIEELEIPIELVISQQMDESLTPEKEELRLFLQNRQTVEYLHYPVEGLLAEHFTRILKDMELLGDLNSYYMIWELLRKEMNSTRKVTEHLEVLMKKYRIPIEKERFEMVCTYRGSSYMKKRWKSYLHRERKTDPSFEEAMDIMIAYFRPIWDALTEGNYYLGDWMPELMRYLD